MSANKSMRGLVHDAIDEGFSDAIKSMVQIAVTNDAGEGPKTALARLDRGLRIVNELHDGADAIVDRLFPS